MRSTSIRATATRCTSTGPFLIVRDGATRGFHDIFYDNLPAGTFDLGAEHSNYYGPYRSYEAPYGDLDYWLIMGRRLADIVAGFARLTGHMAFGPRWSLGFAQTAMALADAARLAYSFGWDGSEAVPPRSSLGRDRSDRAA